MDRTGEYNYAKQNKTMPNTQRPNVLSDMWIVVHNKDGGRKEVFLTRKRVMKGGEYVCILEG